jgi:hypothetical protein
MSNYGARQKQLMWQFLQIRKGCRAAIATISPFVEDSRRRLGEIYEEVWLDPYMIGFMAMLITLAAQKTTKSLGSQSMGHIQSEAWARITGLNRDIVGEQISYLSGSSSQDFSAGCRDASAFFNSLSGAPIDDSAIDLNTAVRSLSLDGAKMNELNVGARALWVLYFDETMLRARAP